MTNPREASKPISEPELLELHELIHNYACAWEDAGRGLTIVSGAKLESASANLIARLAALISEVRRLRKERDSLRAFVEAASDSSISRDEK